MKVIDYKKIEENIRNLMSKNPLCLVLKSNAYGFDVDIIVDISYRLGVMNYAVNTIEEAIHLRDRYKDISILLFGYQIHNISLIKQYNILPTVSTIEEYNEYIKKNINIAIKIDSGMNRFGFKNIDEGLLSHKNVKVIYTHFYKETADNYDLIDYITQLSDKYNLLCHFGGSMAYHYTNKMIRVGEIIYEGADCLYGRVAFIKEVKRNEEVGYLGSYKADRDIRIAIIDVGYANGVRRDFNGRVYLRRKMCDVVGKVCMNNLFILVDESIKIGDVVEFYGENISKAEFLENNMMIKHESFLLIR